MNNIDKILGERIKGLREKAGINQQELANKLGVSRPTLSQIENGERKLNPDELYTIARLFNTSIDVLLNLKSEPEVIIDYDGKIKATKNNKSTIRINVPQSNLQKFKEALLYILNKAGSKPHVGETVIYKLLYFIDFDYYEKYEEHLTGATYIKNHYGPTPAEFKKIIEKMINDKEIIKVDSEYFNYPQTKYLPLRTPEIDILKGTEISVIDSVLNRLSDMNASQISDYSHEDVPWMVTEEGDTIEYETVFYRTRPYSVREYENDI